MAEQSNPFRREDSVDPLENRDQFNISAEAFSGGIIKPLYSERQMKCYTVTDEELGSVSVWNAQTTTFISVGAFILSLGIGFLVDGLFTESLTAVGQLLQMVVGPICVLLSGVFFYLGWQARRTRKNLVDKIKQQSSHVPDCATPKPPLERG